MMRTNTVSRSLLSLAATAILAVPALVPSRGFAETQLTFKSGSTWRGEVNQTVEVTYLEAGKEAKIEGKLIRADKSMVVVEGMVAGKLTKKTIFVGDIKSMKTTAAAADATAAASASPGSSDAKTADKTANASADKPAAKGDKPGLPPNYPGVFYLPLEGMVGTGTREEEIRAIGEEADKFGPGQIIVLEITSPGGMVLEADQIHPTMRELRKRHRVVAWIKEAISAAAFTALHCDEIYFMKEGAMGSMTMFSGTTAIKGEELQAWLKLAGEVAAESGRDPQIARCMIKKDFSLSYDIPPGGGPKDAVFRPDTKGQFVLDTPDTMLTLNSSNALACGISDGTADTTDELAKLLNLPEWKEANDVGRRLYRDWHRMLDTGQEEIPKLVLLFGQKGGNDAAAQIGGMIQTIEKLLNWWEKCPECIIEVSQKGIGVPPAEVLKRRLKELKDQLAEAKKQERQRTKTN
ncbi:MAG: hypothetical protein U0572_12815 [Phycisphaerales bacterium]